MHRLVLVLFGFNTLFFGMCTMVHAQAKELPMEHTMACQAVERQVSSAGSCNPDGEQSTFRLQGQCAGNSCFLRTAGGEQVASSGDLSVFSVSALPAEPGQPVLLASGVGQLNDAASERAPPDPLSSVVLLL